MFNGGKLPGQETPYLGRAPYRALSMDSCCDSVSGHCARGHHSLGVPCEGGGDGHHVHPISSDHLLAAYHLSAFHRVGLNPAHSSECTYQHLCLQYQRFRLPESSMGGDRARGPGLDLYIHVDGLISIRRLRCPRSEKMEDNPAAATCCLDGSVTSRVSDHWDAVDSWEHRIQSYDEEARHFDGFGSCRHSYLRSRMACYPHLQVHRPRRILLVLEVDLVWDHPSNDDPIHVTLRMLVGHLDSREEDSPQSRGVSCRQSHSASFASPV